MDERDKLKSLIEYVKVLSNLQGNYHNEIRIAIAAIEKELGISVATRNKILSNDNEKIVFDENGVRTIGLKFDISRSFEDNERLIEYYAKNLLKFFKETTKR